VRGVGVACECFGGDLAGGASGVQNLEAGFHFRKNSDAFQASSSVEISTKALQE
jgi:hypothetical protein